MAEQEVDPWRNIENDIITNTVLKEAKFVIVGDSKREAFRYGPQRRFPGSSFCTTRNRQIQK
jgi:hypothetical protein